jgi:glyoxylase-like metal-dependent hydrolase (beta-lactamase superfamily II)
VLHRNSKVWVALAVSAVVAMAGSGTAQQPLPVPQLPIRNFRSPEDTRRTGVRAEDIRAGERPDYTRIRQQLVTLPVRGQVYLIGGAGGNIAVQAGPEGGIIVDTGSAGSEAAVLAAYQTIAARPVRWIINTTDDLDHSGGNELIGKTGQGAPAGPTNLPALGTATDTGAGIISHQVILGRMSAPTGSRPARTPAAWATTSFSGLKKTMYFNGEPIELLHQPAAHAGGDVMVFFRTSDVIAAGDVFNTDRYPYFDAARGGSLQGVIDALNRIIDIAIPELNQQGGTLVIPGHGRIGNETDVVEVRDMATIVRDRIKGMVSKGMTLAQVKAARPTLEYERQYGSVAGPWTSDMLVDAAYAELAPRQPATRGSAR